MPKLNASFTVSGKDADNVFAFHTLYLDWLKEKADAFELHIEAERTDYYNNPLIDPTNKETKK